MSGTPETELQRALDRSARYKAQRARPSAALARLAFGISEGSAPEDVAVRDAAQMRLLTMADALAALVALAVTVQLWSGDALRPWALLIVPLTVVASRAMKLHHRDGLVLSKTTLKEAPALFNVATLCAFITYVGQDVFIDGTLGPEQGLGLWGAFLATSIAVRSGVRRLGLAFSLPERCLLLADAGEAATVRSKLAHGHLISAEVVATVDPRALAPETDGRAVMSDLVRAQDIHRVIVAAATLDNEDLLALIRDMKALGVKVSIKPRLLDVVGTAVEFDDVHGTVFLGVRRFGLTRGQRLTKRAFDVAGAGLLVLVFAPLLLVIAIAIKLDSAGPVLFKQQRVGRDGRRFLMFKFRTMVVDAEARKPGLRSLNEADGLFKIEDDPRVTRVGRVLRSTALDELPQLLNVLRREMSLVGPRPLVHDEDIRVEGWHRRRLHLTPGMTGVWQVLGSARISLQEMVALDYLYIVNWSLWQDIEIMLRTVGFVFGRRGL